MPIGTTYPDPAQQSKAPVPPPTVKAVTTTQATTTQDTLTGRPRSFLPFTTGTFSGATDATLATPTASQTVRLTRIWFMMTEEATAGSAADITLTIYDNGISTGLQVVYYVPSSAVTGIGTELIDMNLGDGYVAKEQGGVITVHASGTLSAGKFLVTAIGNFEDEVR